MIRFVKLPSIQIFEICHIHLWGYFSRKMLWNFAYTPILSIDIKNIFSYRSKALFYSSESCICSVLRNKKKNHHKYIYSIYIISIVYIVSKVVGCYQIISKWIHVSTGKLLVSIVLDNTLKLFDKINFIRITRN